MKTILASLFLVLATAIGALAIAPAAINDNGVLETPANKSSRAIRSILNDIERAGDRLVAVGEMGHIVYSDDLGISWRQADVPVRGTLTALTFIDEQTGWAVGHDAVILKTTDAGTTWQKQLDGTMTGALLTAGTQSALEQIDQQLESESDEDRRYALEDARMNVENLVFEAEREISEGGMRPLMAVHFETPERGFAIGAYGYFFETKDGGATWADASARLPNPDLLHLYGMTRLGHDLVIVGEYGTFLRSADDGQTWEAQEFPYEGTLFGISGAENGKTLVYGLRGNAFVSEDFGHTWENLNLTIQVSLLGGRIDNLGNYELVGMGGNMLVGRRAATRAHHIMQRDRTHFADFVLLDETTAVLVGYKGVFRVDLAGTWMDTSMNSSAGEETGNE